MGTRRHAHLKRQLTRSFATTRQHADKKGPCCPRWVFNIFPTAHTLNTERQSLSVRCVGPPIRNLGTRPIPTGPIGYPNRDETAHEGKLNISLDCEDEANADRNTAVLWKRLDDREKCGRRMVWVRARGSSLAGSSSPLCELCDFLHLLYARQTSTSRRSK